jgi:hypothetical protein
MDRAQENMRCGVCFGVQQVFTVACSHYRNINLVAMGQGFTPGYEDNELERIKEMATAPARNLSDKIEVKLSPGGVS